MQSIKTKPFNRNLFFSPRYCFFVLVVCFCVLNACKSKSQTQFKTENFELETKATYQTQAIALQNGSYLLDNCLIADSDKDAKTGKKSLRMRQQGKFSMQFDVANVAQIQITSGLYANDEPAKWQLWLSNDGGKSYLQLGKNIELTQNKTQKYTFTVPINKTQRIEIRHVEGKRFNIDDITFDGNNLMVRNQNDENKDQNNNSQTEKANHLLLGNPSKANKQDKNNYLLIKNQYALSYNNAEGKPNWVAWHLENSDIGTVQRSNNFRPDDELPDDFKKITQQDYSGSGFDRGHHCPSGDRTNSQTDNDATFLMTNMMPQAANNNQKTWENIESHCREIAQTGNELYIICGSYGQGGEGLKGYKSTVGIANTITVPKNTWKIVVQLKQGTQDLQRIDNKTQIICVDMPNNQNVNQKPWQDYKISVDELERRTGLNFFDAIPKTIQDQLER